MSSVFVSALEEMVEGGCGGACVCVCSGRKERMENPMKSHLFYFQLYLGQTNAAAE